MSRAHTITTKGFGRKLKEYRLRKGWTLRQLSGVTGYPTATLSRIENGRVEPHELTMANIIRALPNVLEEQLAS